MVHQIQGLPNWVRCGLFALLILLLSRAGVHLSLTTEGILAPFWPASGFGAAILILFGPGFAPCIYLGTMASNFLSGDPIAFVLLGPLGNMMESLAAWWIVTRWRKTDPRLSSLRDVVSVGMLGAWIPPLISAAVGVTLLWSAGYIAQANLASAYLLYWLANGMGILLITPFLLTWGARFDPAWLRENAGALLGWSCAVVVASVVAFYPLWPESPFYPLAYLPFPFLIGAALQLGARGAALNILSITITATLFTIQGVGPFITPTLLHSLALLIAYCIVLVMVGLPLGSVIEALQQSRQRTEIALGAGGLCLWEWREQQPLEIYDAKWKRRLLDSGANLQDLPPLKGARDPSDIPLDAEHSAYAEFPLSEHQWLAIACKATGFGWKGATAVTGVLQDISARHALEEARIKQTETNAELRRLQSMMTPHMLFNALTGLRSLIRRDNQLAFRFTTTLAEFMDHALAVSTRETITLKEEIELCRRFVEVQNMHPDKNWNLDIEVAEAAFDCAIPPMLLQTLVENALKHGSLPQTGSVRLYADVETQLLICRATNPGTLRKNSAGQPRTGLASSQQRLRLIFGDDASLHLRQTAENEVTAEVRIPIRKTDE